MQSKASNYSNETIHGYIAMHSKRRTNSCFDDEDLKLMNIRYWV